MIAAWSSNDPANPRITILSLSGLAGEPWPVRYQPPQHIPFVCATLDQLLAAYARLKGVGIEPILTLHLGAESAFYYEDPDHNVVELKLDILNPSQRSSDNPRPAAKWGIHVDPEQMIAARAAGMSVAELHQHAYAGEFLPAKSKKH